MFVLLLERYTVLQGSQTTVHDRTLPLQLERYTVLQGSQTMKTMVLRLARA